MCVHVSVRAWWSSELLQVSDGGGTPGDRNTDRKEKNMKTEGDLTVETQAELDRQEK